MDRNQRTAKRIALAAGAGLLVLALVLAIGVWRRPQPTPEPQPPVSTSESAEPVQVPDPKPAAPAPPEPQIEASIQGTVWYDPQQREPAAGILVTGRNTHSPHNQVSAVTDNTGHYLLGIDVADTSYTLLAEDAAKGLVSLDAPKVEVKAGQSVEHVDLILEKGGSVSGHVLGEMHSYSPANLSAFRTKEEFRSLAATDIETVTKKPLAGVQLTLKSTGSIPVERVATTDEQGAYKFEDLPPGEYVIAPTHPATAVTSDSISLEKRAKLTYPDAMHADGLDFIYRVDGMSITGRVSDTQGKPIAGASITIETAPDSPAGGCCPPIGNTTTTTDNAGDYRVDNLATMDMTGGRDFMANGFANLKHTVRVQMKGYEVQEIVVPAITEDLAQTAKEMVRKCVALGVQGYKTVNPGTVPDVRGHVVSGVDFVLPLGAAISGTFVDLEGKPLTKNWLYIRPEVQKADSSATPSFPQNAWCVPDAKGRFVFEGLPADTYVFFTYLPPGNQPVYAQNKPLTLAAGDSVTDYVVTVDTTPQPEPQKETGIIEGNVARTGDAASNIVLYLYGEGTPPSRRIDRAEKDGYFKLDNVVPGRYTLVAKEVQVPGRIASRLCSSPVIVEAGHTTPVDLTMGGTATLYGTFSFPKEDEIGIIFVLDPSWAEKQLPLNNPNFDEVFPQAVAIGVTRASIPYQFDNLPAGEFVVTSICFSLGESVLVNLIQSPAQTVHLAPGKATLLDLELK